MCRATEHIIYPRVIGMVADGRLWWDEGRARTRRQILEVALVEEYLGASPAEAVRVGFRAPPQSAVRRREAAAEELRPFDATYDWIWHNMTVAVSTLQLEHRDGEPGVRAKSEPRGIGRVFSERPLARERAKAVTDAGVRPLSYKADDGTSSTQARRRRDV